MTREILLRNGALACGFLALLLLEAVWPLRRRTSPWGWRILTNLGVSALALAVGAFVVQPIALRLMGWSAERSFGLLHLVPLPLAAEVAVGFVLMDLSYYYWHRVNHEVAFLSRFHVVHHVDPDLDVTTSFRFHPVEILFSVAFRAVQVALIGASALGFFVYETAFQIVIMFQHSNLRLPVRVERALNGLIVTPRMHGIHHSVVSEERNSNYSAVFRWWDWLHRSLRLGIPQSRITIGVAGYRAPGDNRLLPLAVQPFLRQRDPDLFPDGTPAEREQDGGTGRPNVLSE